MNHDALLVTPLASPSTETQALLSNTISSRHEKPSLLKICLQRLSHTTCQLRYLCLLSKAATLLLLWTAVIGAVHTTALEYSLPSEVSFSSQFHHHHSLLPQKCMEC